VKIRESFKLFWDKIIAAKIKGGDLLMGVGCAFIKNMSIYIRIILLSSFLDKMVLY
jgi:hypothetical protein